MADRTESRKAAEVLDELSEHAWTGPSNGCARCEGGHDGQPLYWKPFRIPVAADDGSKPWTHWAACPVTGDPILSREKADG